MVDNYRVNLFKKKLREIFKADWVRFYWSKDREHLCLSGWHYGKANLLVMRILLRKAGIDFTEIYDSTGVAKMYGQEPELDCVLIPIDQDALPERKAARGTKGEV